jgi:hypothetical protein
MSYSDNVLNYKSEFISQPDVVSKTDSYFLSTYIKKSNKDFKPESFNGQFIPGQIYCFRYNTKSQPDENRKFINRLPFVLVTDIKKNKQGDSILHGVDLVATPPGNRINLIGSVYDYSKEEIEKIIKAKRESKASSALQINPSVVKEILSRRGYEASLYTFKVAAISDVCLIEYDDWKKLPYMSVALLEGSTPIEIYSDYRSKLK